MANPFGFSLYGMKSLSMADAIRGCAQIGYDGVELALLPGWPTEPAKLGAAARRELRDTLIHHRQRLLGLMENLSEPASGMTAQQNLDRLKAAAELGHALQPDQPPPIETILGGKPADWPMVKERLIERLRLWAEVGRTSQTVLAIKPHVAQALHTPADAKALIDTIASPWLRLTFDYSHYHLRRIPLADAAATVLPVSVFAHIKDARGTPERFQFVLPGDGETDYRALRQAMAQANYTGPIVVEVSSQIFNQPGYDPLTTARRCYAQWNKR